jgi:hypothetical protein
MVKECHPVRQCLAARAQSPQDRLARNPSAQSSSLWQPTTAMFACRTTAARLTDRQPGRSGIDSDRRKGSASCATPREIPSRHITLILNFGDPLTLAGDDGRTQLGSFATGLQTCPAIIEHRGQQAGVHIRMPPTTAYALFGIPMHLLTGKVMTVAEVLGPRTDRAWCSAVSPVARSSPSASPPRWAPRSLGSSRSAAALRRAKAFRRLRRCLDIQVRSC